MRCAGLCLLLLAITACLTAGCDTQDLQDEFAEAASLPPQGIVQTDAQGNILEEDEDDWRTAPLYRGVLRVDPAYPNPASETFITIPVTVTQFNAVRGGLTLRVYNNARELVALDQILEADAPGAYVFNFASGLLPRTGLHRLFIFDGAGEIVSYGDLLIE